MDTDKGRGHTNMSNFIKVDVYTLKEYTFIYKINV